MPNFPVGAPDNPDPPMEENPDEYVFLTGQPEEVRSQTDTSVLPNELNEEHEETVALDSPDHIDSYNEELPIQSADPDPELQSSSKNTTRSGRRIRPPDRLMMGGNWLTKVKILLSLVNVNNQAVIQNILGKWFNDETLRV